VVVHKLGGVHAAGGGKCRGAQQRERHKEIYEGGGSVSREATRPGPHHGRPTGAGTAKRRIATKVDCRSICDPVLKAQGTAWAAVVVVVVVLLEAERKKKEKNISPGTLLCFLNALLYYSVINHCHLIN
jgi:hypothetical protein